MTDISSPSYATGDVANGYRLGEDQQWHAVQQHTLQQGGMNVKARAKTAARIFDILAWIVLAIGGLAVAGLLIATFAAAVNDGIELAGLLLVYTGLTVFYVALTWAFVTLGTAVAGYIGQKAD